MKKGFLNNFANWILDKLATKVYNQLATSNKTMIGALNELNSKTLRIENRLKFIWADEKSAPGGVTGLMVIVDDVNKFIIPRSIMEDYNR